MRFKIPAKQPGSFRLSAAYLAGHSKGQTPERVAWAEARNLQTENPRAAAAIMEATAAQNLRCKKPVYHFVLSFDPKDARRGKVPPEVMQEIANEAVERLGLTEHQMLIYAHKDTKHPHMHFLVNRIHSQTGKAFDRHNDGRNLTRLCRDIAKERGLNIPLDRARIKERERVDDFDELSKLKREPPPPPNIKEGEYW
jgi:MobA/VirD2-like, nuclease domain